MKMESNKFIHPSNRSAGSGHKDTANLQVVSNRKGQHPLGCESHLESLMGAPKGADITGHNGKMKW